MKKKFNVEITPELLKRAQNRLDHILNEGCLHSGISDKFDSNVKPEWYDEERLKKAQKIAKEYLTITGNSAVIGLFLVLNLPIGLLPLLATGQSKNVPKLFSRYLNTILHVNSWYKHDPFDENSKAFKSQQMVKSMHKNACKLMNTKLSVYEFVKRMVEETNKEKNNNENELDIEKLIGRKDRKWISQTDMALTQWAFIGVLILEPTACGGHALTKEKITEIAYLWRVFGYRIGIEDEFNLFNDLDYDFLYTICKLILEQEYIPIVENCVSPMGIRMCHSTNLGLQPMMPSIKFKPFLKYWYKVLSINSYKLNRIDLNTDKYEFQMKNNKIELSEEDKKLMIKNGYNTKYIPFNPQIPFEELKIDSFTDKFFFYLWNFNIGTMLKGKWFRNFTRKITKSRCNRSLKNKNKHMNNMEKKFGQNQYHQHPACPFAGHIDNNYLEFVDVNK